MASLTDLVASRMTPEVMLKLAGLAGISSTNAKRAIDAIIPTQLYDLVSMSITEAGANRLLRSTRLPSASVTAWRRPSPSAVRAGRQSSLTYASCGRRRILAPGSSSKTPSVSPGRGCAVHANHDARVWRGRDGSTAVSSCPEA
jgi:hypothetical protein